MKSTLIVIAVALASGLLVASGAVAGEGCCVMGPQVQQVGSRHEIDVMGPEYTDPDLREIEELSPVDSPPAPWSHEMAPAASSDGIDVMGPEYTTPDLRSAISEGQAGKEEMAPAAAWGEQAPEEMRLAASSSH